jgi:hypothetical protein
MQLFILLQLSTAVYVTKHVTNNHVLPAAASIMWQCSAHSAVAPDNTTAAVPIAH